MDGKKNGIRLAEPVTEYNFSILFAEDGTFEGYASVNLGFGKFNYQPSQKISLAEFTLSTKAGEFPDGWFYIETMTEVSSYRISSKGLALYYDAQKYLLFKPQEVKPQPVYDILN